MNDTLNFDEAMKRLSIIANELEKDDLPLDNAIALFEEGLELSSLCQKQLKGYESKVSELVKKHSGEQ